MYHTLDILQLNYYTVHNTLCIALNTFVEDGYISDLQAKSESDKRHSFSFNEGGASETRTPDLLQLRQRPSDN
jgi:hypothetical protein